MTGTRSENLDPDVNSQIETYPRDLLRRFGSGSFPDEEATVAAVKEEAVVEQVELSLGLSLGGSFGVDPANKGLVRSSSVAAFSFFPKKEEEDGKESVLATHFLMRTCSLPVETGEEQRKRKEMQSLRRLEAKRKREEKRGLRPKPDDNFGAGDVQHVEGLVFPRSAAMRPFDSSTDRSDFPPFSSTLPGRRRRQDQHNHTSESPPIPGRLPAQQLSAAGVQVEGCSTSSSEYDCRPMQGLDISGLCRNGNPTRSKSPPSIISPMKQTIQKAAVLPLAPPTGKGTGEEGVSVTSKKASMEANGSRKMMGRSMMEEMPCVSTKGDGPNGRRIEGFLCKYTKGEDVRIMCVCHGSFLSPAEFVKHAGGGDVEFPLRHIVVYPSQQTYL